MPQDTIWTGDYIQDIQAGRKDTSPKQISLHMDSGAVDRIFYNAGLKDNTSPYPFFIVLIIIIVGIVLFRKNKTATPKG